MTLRFWDENFALYTTSDTFAVVVNATYKNLSNLFFSQNSPWLLVVAQTAKSRRYIQRRKADRHLSLRTIPLSIEIAFFPSVSVQGNTSGNPQRRFLGPPALSLSS